MATNPLIKPRTLHELLDAGDTTPKDRSRYLGLIADADSLLEEWQSKHFEQKIFEAPVQNYSVQRPSS